MLLHHPLQIIVIPHPHPLTPSLPLPRRSCLQLTHQLRRVERHHALPAAAAAAVHQQEQTGGRMIPPTQ